jgi:hypothetical protein
VTSFRRLEDVLEAAADASLEAAYRIELALDAARAELLRGGTEVE